MSSDQPPTDPPNQPAGRLVLPDSLLAIESVPDAIDAYLAAGLRPILIHYPLDGNLCTCGKKHDRTKSGSSSAGKHPIANNWQKQPADRDVIIDQLARLRFTPNLGIALGRQPIGGYIVGIDIDDEERYKALEAELGPLPETPNSTSGRGRHLFYEMPVEIDLSRVINVTGIGGEPGVDAKREGGQVVVAPSLHASGKRYKWVRAGAIAKLPMPWAMELLKAPEVPEWVGEYTPQSMNADKKAKKRAEKYLEKAVIGEASALARCGEGMRNNTLYRSAYKMFGYCASLYLGGRWQWVHDELLAAAKVSGLPEREARRTIESADKSLRDTPDFRLPVVFQNREQPPREQPSTSSSEESSTETATAEPIHHDHVAPSGRPVIKVTTELHENVKSAIDALKNDSNVYQREKKLVCIARISREQRDASSVVPTDDEEIHRQLVEGTPQICDLELPTVRELLSKVAVFQKWVEKVERYVPILPTDEIVSAVHKRKQWNGIRSIIGVIETPTFRPDGAIVQTEGYDQITRYLYLPSEKFPPITDEIATQKKAEWAFQFLSEAFHDFPYATDAHRSVPIAAILTLIARPAILGSVPAFLFDASTRGSGKTLQTDTIATIVTGRGAPRMNYTSDEVELEKILGGYALSGSQFICLDNVPVGRYFGGGPLDRVLTARDMVDLRILGSTKVLTLPWRAVVMATGNNMQLFSDTARRVLMARLEPKEENPENRTDFKHKNLLAWVRAQRPRLVSAALLILRAYWRSGCPPMGCGEWGSFEEWNRIIPNAIVFAGGADPTKARPESDEEVDAESRSIRCFVTQVHRLIQEDEFRISQIVELLYGAQRKRDENGHVNDGLQDLRDAIETIAGRKGIRDGKPDAVEFGRRLAAFKGRIIGSLRLVSKTGAGGILKWKIVPSSMDAGTNRVE